MRTDSNFRPYGGDYTDDGTGPYTHCQRGDSRCLDQCCPCVPGPTYWLAYRLARGGLRPPAWLWGGALAVAWCGLLAWAGWALGGN